MIETKVAYITLIEENILRIEYKPDCFVDIQEYEENLQAYKKLIKEEKVYLLTIAPPGASVSLEVRNKFSTRERSSFKIAEAFVISTSAHRLIANFVIKVQKPKHPLRFFGFEFEAMEWLMELKANEIVCDEIMI